VNGLLERCDAIPKGCKTSRDWVKQKRDARRKEGIALRLAEKAQADIINELSRRNSIQL